MNVREIAEKKEWDTIVNQQCGHPLQLWGWGELKSSHNWQALRLAVEQDGEWIGGVQLLTRRLPWPFRSLHYMPRGPFGAVSHSPQSMKVLASYIKYAKGGMCITAEPDQTVVEWGREWKKSTNTILIPRTMILDLTLSEDELLSSMTKKTRQYIRKSERSGVTVRQVEQGDDFDEMLSMYHQTAARAGFSLHDDKYYRDCAEMLGKNNDVFGAYHEGKLISFVWLAKSQTTAFELYGGMSEKGQQLRANYILKWRAILEMKSQDVARYDMNGLLNDGISSFKQGFGDTETMLAGTYDYRFSAWYIVWQYALPMGKKLLRTFSSLRN